ncbi:MAG: outer membrane lipoprotein carrier protein LolA [Blastocatellia bacterium]|nr:outer membrane lipoprotein carrier protein LolA [Blastocatellia bacterium]
MNKVIKSFLFTSFAFSALFVVSAVTANGQGALGQILNRMDAHYRGLNSLNSNIVMVKTDAALGAAGNVETVGTVSFIPERKPGKMYVRLDWTKPKESMIVIGDDYRLINYTTNTALCGKKDDTKTNAKVAGPLSFIGMSKEQLKANYSVIIASKDEQKLSDGTLTMHIRLTPKARSEYKYAELWVDGNGLPRQAMVVSNNGDSTSILIRNPSTNGKVDRSTFTLALPKGMKCTQA